MAKKKKTESKPLDALSKSRLALTLGQVIQNRSNGCLHPSWSRTVGEEMIEAIESAYRLVKRDDL